MGGCLSQKGTDSEAMSAEIDVCTAVERSAGNDLVHNRAEEVPTQGGSSQYVGAFVQNDTAHKNAVEPTVPVSNNQLEQPLPYVSSDVNQDRSEHTVDVPFKNEVKTSAHQPRNQKFEEEPITVEIVYNQVNEEQPVELPARHNQMEKLQPPVTSAVQHDYQNENEPVFDVPLAGTMKTILDEPIYPRFEEHPMVERTVHNQIMEEQPVHYEEQLVYPFSSGVHSVSPAQPSATHASVKVRENLHIAEMQQPTHDLGIVFEGRTYQMRVFDPNINDYVLISKDDLQPRGRPVM